ncbi:AraC family transcriptional regulator [Reinekea marinisedimentorum]|uniref:AraC family transcriptional regulator n=1 Tax=Reinekea marinisedimentorum TaxID=230495 RepID=A0A4R3I507_9GAMM|nr:GyrI-like domain-containing protein [Reinekea marinisedimentorum]TCS41033.1 AraC family transcriptional regulator [Reinekea marinisedimentorum]
MDRVQIVEFPETKIAVIEHRGSPALEHQSVLKLVQWRKANQMPPSAVHRSYGIHYNDPFHVAPQAYRVDLAVSVQQDVPENDFGVINKVIPALRCAMARHLGSRTNVSTAKFLMEKWLPQSGETLADFPVFFHYVNVGPDIKEDDMITDVYLPIQP